MAAGKLDQRIRFERKVRSGDGGGGSTTTWTPVIKDVFADVTPLDGREGFEAGRQQPTARYRIEIRNRDDIDSSMRIVWESNGNLVLNVREMPTPAGGRRALYRHVFAEEGVAV